MENNELLAEAKEIFGNDYYASQLTGIEILAADVGYSKVALKLRKEHNNALGHVMGGVYLRLPTMRLRLRRILSSARP